jgi:hypothetical protein
MSGVSTVRKIGIITRVAARQAGRNRTLSALWRAGVVTARSAGKVLHQLWLEVTGFVFLVIAAIGGMALVREVHKYQSGEAVLGRVILAIIFTLLFLWFGLSSFWSAAKKSRK